MRNEYLREVYYMFNVAIDGPAGAGKSTIAKAAAKELGFIYVDTGALYRAIAYNAVTKGVIDDTQKIIDMLIDTNVELKYVDGVQAVYLNGDDVSAYIRTPEISMGASKVSAIPQVREFLLNLQRDIAQKNNVIMDGRDIATVVLPNADVKIFLFASPECRAQRRYKELMEKGEDVTFEDVLADVNQRDYQDSHREIAPLKRAKNLLRTPADARSALAIRAVIAFAHGFRFRPGPVIMADLQHTAVSAVVIAVPAVLRLAVFAVICHGVHPPEIRG